MRIALLVDTPRGPCTASGGQARGSARVRPATPSSSAHHPRGDAVALVRSHRCRGRESQCNVVRFEVHERIARSAASAATYRPCTTLTRRPRIRGPHDLDRAGDRRAAHLVPRPRVVEHEHRPAVSREVAHFPAARGGREDHAPAVPGVPHRSRVDEAGQVVRREDADQPCIEELTRPARPRTPPLRGASCSASARPQRGRYASRDPSCIVR